MTRRERIYNKFGGRCAYSGTPLEPDWQIDHVKPIIRTWNGYSMYKGDDTEENMVPVQKIINHYKRDLPLHLFRSWYLGDLHKRLKRLPKNPKTERSIRKKEYLLKVASYFNITPEKPFSGQFYFETLNTEPCHE